jgi:hypothetical protein
MQAFVDDSGGKGQTSVFVLAGAFGPSEKWAEFSDEWQGVLDIDPPLAYFKAREAAGLTGQFLRWGPEARDERLALLVRTIDRHGFRRIEVSIDLQAYEEVMAAFGIYPWRDPYFLAFQEIIMGVCRDLLAQGQQERFEILGLLEVVWVN